MKTSGVEGIFPGESAPVDDLGRHTSCMPARPRTALTVRLYLATLAAACLLLWGLADRWWPATLVMYAPRWVWALPWPVLAWMARRDRRAWPALVLAALLCLWPLMGARLPMPQHWAAGDEAAELRVATYNIGGAPVDPSAVPALFASLGADMIALQECAQVIEAARPLLEREGWQVNVRHSACLASRHPILKVEDRPPQDVWQLGGSGVIVRYTVRTPAREVQLLNLHLETVREGLQALRHEGWRGVQVMNDNLAQRDLESNMALAWARQAGDPLIVAGDFNMPVESAIYRRYWSGFANAFSRTGWGFGYTKATRWHGIRIDHVLGGPGWQPLAARLADNLGNDHRPLVTAWRWAPS